LVRINREAPVINTHALAAGNVDGYYHQTLSVNGASPIYWWIDKGCLPNGLTFYNGIGIIEGAPMNEGTFNFTLRAGNILGSDVRAFSIEVKPAESPIITTNTLPEGNLNSGYYQKLDADGTFPATWSIESDSLPPGLQLSDEGVIFGVPTAAGIYKFDVKAENSGGYDAKNLIIGINPIASGAPMTGGYIEIEGKPYYNDEEISRDDVPVWVWNDWVKLKFIPIPENAMINTIEWNYGDMIFEGNGAGVRVKENADCCIDYHGGDIEVVVNGDFIIRVHLQPGPDG
jgi:hypothetical protein